MKQKHIVIPALILIVLVAILVYIFWPTPPISQMSHVSLRLRWVHQAQFAGIYWAIDSLIFKANQLDVEVLQGGPGINFVQTVATGKEEFGIAGAAQIVEARDHGVPVVALAIVFQKNPNIFFSKTSSGIKTPNDWTGKRIAVYYGYDIEYIYRALLKIHNVDSRTISESPATVDIGPFLRDEVDVWAGYKINQPLLAEEQGVEINRMDPDDDGITVPGDVLFSTDKFVKENPTLVQQMVSSCIAGWEAALNDTATAVDLVLKWQKSTKRQHESNMIRVVKSLTIPERNGGKIGWMDLQQWQRIIDIWKEFGGIKSGQLSAESCFDNSFVKIYHERKNHP